MVLSEWLLGTEWEETLILSFFNRDVNCIRRFFRRRFHFEGTTWPLWKDVLAELREQEGQGTTLGDNAAGLDIVEEDEEEEEEEGQGKAARHGQSTSAGEEDATAQAEGSDTRKVRIVEPASHATTAAESTAQEDAEPEQERPKRVRIDLEVEASGFGRGLQTELEAVSTSTLNGDHHLSCRARLQPS